MKLPFAALVALCLLGSPAAYCAFEWDVDLGNAGIEITGMEAGDETGFAVAALNVNGDDYADLLIGAPYANDTGIVYLVYGKADLFTEGNIDLTNLGTRGMVINGELSGDLLGWSITALGDLNSDGKDDFLLGAPGFDGGMTDRGRGYLIYGRDDFGATLNLVDPNAADFIIDGEADFDALGLSMGWAGNFGGAPNPKGMLIGAPLKDTLGIAAGAAYVVFWDAGLTGTVTIDALLTQGKALAFTGNVAVENAGCSVAGGFDYNNDTFDDIIIGVPGADYGSAFIGGRAYVVLGGDTGMTGTYDLNTLSSGTGGIAFDGASNFEQAGCNVLGVSGFFSEDGFDDIVISAPLASTNGLYSGQVYVVHGNTSTASPIDLGSIGAGGGTVFLGNEAEDGKFGLPLADLGDVDQDGMTDIVIGASYASPGQDFSGVTYVAMGSRHAQLLEELGELVPWQPVITGADEGDFSGCAVAGGADLDNDGFSDLVIGARGWDASMAEKKGRVHVVPGSGFAMATKGDGMTEMPYMDASGDLTPGSVAGFDVHLQVDTAWSQQTSPTFPGYFLLAYEILNPGANYKNITIWADILNPAAIIFWVPVDSATGYAKLHAAIPGTVTSGQVVLQQLWPNPSNPGNNFAATNCIRLKIPE